MKSRLAAIFALTFVARVGAFQPAGPVVGSIAVDSDGVFDVNEVSRLLEIRVGQPLDTDTVRRSIQNLYATERYAQIVVESENEAGGRVDIVVHIFRAFRVATIRFSGNPVSSDELRRSLGYSLGGAYQGPEVSEGVERLRRLLATEGFFDAQVSVSTEFRRESFEAIVTYKIEAGAPTRLAPPVFDGALDPFTARELAPELREKVGQRYREERVKKDAERLQAFLLAKSYLRAEVRLIGVETREAHAAPVFRVDVGPRIVFETTGVEEKRVRSDFLGLLNDRVFQEDFLVSYVESLRRRYQETGYHSAKVSYSIEPFPGGQRVVLTVERGPRQSIERVELEEVHSFSQAKIRALLLTHSRTLLRRGRLVDAVLEEDRQAVVGFYRAGGFLQADVAAPVVTPGKQADALVVTLRVQEGPRTLIAKNGIEGVERADLREMQKLLTLSAGKPLNPQTVQDDRVALVGYLRDNGWTTAAVDAAVEYSADRSTADLTYRVVEGDREFFGRTIVTGNTRTNTDRLLLPFRYAEGEPFSEAKLLESQRDLSRTGVFQKVSLERELPDPSTSERNVVVRVAEGRPVSIHYGVGYQYEEGTGDQSPFGILGIGYNNLFGTLRSISLESRYAPLTGNGKVFLNYRDPFFFAKDVPLIASVFYSREPIQKIDVKRRGLFFEAAKQMTKRVRVGLRYEFQRIETGSSDPLELERIQPFDQNISESTIGATLIYEGRDDLIDPHRGFFVSSFIQDAFPVSFLSADAKYVKGYVQASAYRPFLGGVFAASVRAGAFAIPGGCRSSVPGAAPLVECIPVAERFFSGGRTSARAWDTNILGIPGQTVDYSVIETAASQAGKGNCRTEIDPSGNFNCDFGPRIIGGASLLGWNAEWRFPIVGDLGGTLFYDAAQVWEDGKIRFSVEGTMGLRQSVGIGLRYLTAVGPIRFEYARVLQPRSFSVPVLRQDPVTKEITDTGQTVRESESKNHLYLSIGYPF